MQSMTLGLATLRDLSSLAVWIVDVCQKPEQHCLHSWADEDPDTLCMQLRKYLYDGELLYAIARRNGMIVGAMGCEYDEELGRGWLHGPHAITKDWNSTASKLFAKVLDSLPRPITSLCANLNIKNVRAQSFYRKHGFKEEPDRSYDYRVTREQPIPPIDKPYASIQERHTTSFLDLYKTLFPNAYYSGDRILKMIGSSHQVFVSTEGTDVLGFAVVAVDEAHETGEVQFLGVREEFRRQGIARRLLLTAVHWLIDTTSVSEACLCVRDTRVGARRLYESVGFELRYTGIGFKKNL